MLRPGSRALSPVTRQPSLLLYSSGGSFNRPGADVDHPGEEQLVIDHRLDLERRAAQPGDAVAHDRQLGAGDRLEVFVGDVAEPAPGIREVLADVDLVAGEDADGELAAGGDQRMRVVLRRHAGHQDRFLEADLAHPVAAVRAGHAVVVGADDLDALHHLAEAALDRGVDHQLKCRIQRRCSSRSSASSGKAARMAPVGRAAPARRG